MARISRTWGWPPAYRLGSCLAPLMIGLVIALALTPAILLYGASNDDAGGNLIATQGFVAGAIAATYWTILLAFPLLCRILLIGTGDAGIAKPGWALLSFGLRNGLHAVAEATILPTIRNTWLIVIYFRLMGARIGAHCYIGTTKIAEPHLVRIGQNVFLGHNVAITAHLAERGGVHYSPVVIGDRASVGNDVTIMPGCVVEPDVTIAAGSIVPKGRCLEQGRTYAGAPAREVTPAILAVV